MAAEIERKFLVTSDAWRLLAQGKREISQGYLAVTDRVSVRIRVDGGDRATLTLKSARQGASREEYEFDVPLGDAAGLLGLVSGEPIEKTRHTVIANGLTWEIDAFGGLNEGLVLAEVELATADQRVPLPDWVGAEVTDDERYYNASLATKPFQRW